MNNIKANPLPALAPLIEREANFLSWCIDYARLKGWRVHHTRPAWSTKGYRTPIQGDAGFPDLVLARNGIVFCMELKSEKGKLSPAQREWVTEIGSLSVGVFKPSDREKIKRILE